MIKELLNVELKDHHREGLQVNIIKKYVIKTPCKESFLVRNHSIILVKSGQFKMKLKQRTQELGAHDLIILPKKTYCTVPDVKDKLQFFLICFTSDFALENTPQKETVDFFTFLLGEAPSKITLEDNDFRILSLIYKLIDLINKNAGRNGKDSGLEHLCFNLFLYELKFMFNQHNSGLAVNICRQQRLTVEFLRILIIHCKKQHSVKFYADALFVTPGHLNKIVKQGTGNTVKNLIDKAIINEIKEDLENSHSTITSIADDFEFSSLSKLSAFFKRHTSISASQYRSNTKGRF